MVPLLGGGHCLGHPHLPSCRQNSWSKRSPLGASRKKKTSIKSRQGGRKCRCTWATYAADSRETKTEQKMRRDKLDMDRDRVCCRRWVRDGVSYTIHRSSDKYRHVLSIFIHTPKPRRQEEVPSIPETGFMTIFDLSSLLQMSRPPKQNRTTYQLVKSFNGIACSSYFHFVFNLHFGNHSLKSLQGPSNPPWTCSHLEAYPPPVTITLWQP